MGGDAGGDDTFFDVITVRQAKVLCRGYVAEEGSTGGCCDCASDGSRDMVVARRDVRHQRTEHVERGALADGLLDLHIGSDLVEWHMSRTFDHDLDIFLPGAAGQLTECQKLFQL